MQIASPMLDEVVMHARDDAPNECCGVLGVRDGTVISVHRLVNLAASPMRFEVDGLELMRVMDALEDDEAEMGVIYHSHPRSEPYPSQTDINFAASWPGVEWLIVGLAGAEPVTRSYLIDGPTVTEIPVVLV